MFICLFVCDIAVIPFLQTDWLILVNIYHDEEEIYSEGNLEFVVFSLLRPKKIEQNVISFIRRHGIDPENICVIFYNYFGHYSRPILDQYLLVWSIETSLSILNLMVGLTIKVNFN